MTEYNVHEALYILNKYYLTDSMQMVTRWIREGKINAVRSENRKDGWRITHDDLFDFIEKERPGLEKIFLQYEEDQEKKMPFILYQKLKSKFDEEKGASQHSVQSDNNNDTNSTAEVKADRGEPQMQSEENDFKKKLSNTTTRLEKLEDQFESLFTIVNEINQKIENANVNSKKPMKEKTHVDVNSNKHPISYKEALEKLKSAISEQSVDPENEKILTTDILRVYFNESSEWKEGVYIGDKTYRCPINNKNFKSVKSMLKNAVEKKVAENDNEDKTTENNVNKDDTNENNTTELKQDIEKADDYNANL